MAATGATSSGQPVAVSIPYPQEDRLALVISAGACRLRLSGGATEWASGTYEDPSGQIPLQVESVAGTVTVGAGRKAGEVVGLASGIPTLTLALGTAHPFSLRVESGASGSVLDIGGVPVTELVFNHGAGTAELTFGAPNPQPMDAMRISMGAGRLVARGLSDSNCAEIQVDAGAARCVLDFSGSLRRPATVKVTAGVASVEIAVPAGLPAEITSETILGRPRADAGYTRSATGYLSAAAAGGEPVVLRIRSSMALGSVQLVTIA